jgi:hypothetical protein
MSIAAGRSGSSNSLTLQDSFQIEVDSKPYLLCLVSLPQIRGNWNSLGSGRPTP